MATPTNKIGLKEYCLRKLGFPVIEINVDDDQVDDRIDEAINLFRQFHFDGVRKVYMKRQITSDDVTNKYIPVDDGVIGVNKIFILNTAVVTSSSSLSFNMFDLNYQIRLNELYDFTSADYVYFELANQHIRTLEMLFIGDVPIRFNRYDNKLYLDANWGNKLKEGHWIIAEAYAVISTETTLFWNDPWLKRYSTALIKKQWGNNLKKFAGAQLPGGIAVNGQQIYDEAVEECKELETELRDMYEEPPMFEVG